ncbi:hypothetical protein UES1_130 [Escherichia phage UE-S1]|nr:hypothetical protein UES1_130 [Escherichia phage UE-S1]
MSNILNEKTVDVVIDVLENSNTFEKKYRTVYFGEYCWLNYTSENLFIIRVETDDIGLTIHNALNKSGKKITIILDKSSTSSFCDRIDDCEHFTSTFYDTEEEHFMASTVKELPIPFKLMKATRDFILKYKKSGVYNDI